MRPGGSTGIDPDQETCVHHTVHHIRLHALNSISRFSSVWPRGIYSPIQPARASFNKSVVSWMWAVPATELIPRKANWIHTFKAFPATAPPMNEIWTHHASFAKDTMQVNPADRRMTNDMPKYRRMRVLFCGFHFLRMNTIAVSWLVSRD